jgi:hypothetical protein
LFVSIARTSQNAGLALLIRWSAIAIKWLLYQPSSRIAPGLYRGHIQGVSIVCYQVTAQFVFYQYKPALVSTHLKKQNAKVFLVLSGLPFGHALKYSRFFHTQKEAANYVSYLHTVYKNRIISSPAHSGGQLSLFQE